jgi:transcriptional regulator with XRE-family HTH domain
MDDLRIGAIVRALRQRKGWRQADLAVRATVSATLIARIERGALGSIPMGKLRRVVGALGGRLDTIVRWQGADLARLLDVRHASMHELMAGLFDSLDGWVAEPEVSFSIYGERGIIDILAWHPARRMLLVIELKTEVVDVSRLLGSMDQRRRLAWQLARDRGWRPAAVSTWVVVADGRTNRRVVARHTRVLRSKFPVDGRRLRSWLRDPASRIDALSFLPDRHGVMPRRDTAPRRRIRAR